MPNPDSWRSAAPAYPWQQVYKAAVLERDPAKMEQFIQSAFTSIYEHLRARGDITDDEATSVKSFSPAIWPSSLPESSAAV